MLRRTLLISAVLLSFAFVIEAQQRQSSRSKKRSTTSGPARRTKRTRPVTVSAVHDSGGPELIVRILDVGQGDAIYVRNGSSRVLIDGGPEPATLGRYLDSLRLNNTTIDVVILSHQHLDHYSGLRELFRTSRHIRVRYFFENKDPATPVTLAILRDSILSRMDRDSLVYRDTDDPCGDGRKVCTIAMTGGAKLDILAPDPEGASPNNRSAAVKIIGPDSATFTMWLAGDAEHEAIDWFERAGYPENPGMGVDVLKADHHGSCNGVTPQYLRRLHPKWVVASVGAHNEYGHMHSQAETIYRTAGIPWYRTDRNGTVTIRSPGTPAGGFTITPDHGDTNMSGSSDRRSSQIGCM